MEPLTEEWRSVPGFPLYRVSNRGRFMSLQCGGRILKGHRRYVRGRPAAIFVWLLSDQKRIIRAIHTIVLEAFVGPCPEGMEGCHDNGDPFDNDLGNLRWGTHRSNVDDAMRHGTVCRGEDAHLAVLNADDVRCIRAEPYWRGMSRMLSRAFGVSVSNINMIRARTQWKHVEQII